MQNGPKRFLAVAFIILITDYGFASPLFINVLAKSCTAAKL
jgi:hypothetical protein